MEYKIGELADILGVSSATVRYYERIGLVKSRRSPDNNYRVFSIIESERLIDMKSLQQLGLSLDEANSILTSADRDSAFNKLHEHRNKLLKDIEHLQSLMGVLDQILSMNENKGKITDKCQLTMRPELLRIPIFMEKANPVLEKLRKAWIAAFPFTWVSPRFRIGTESILYDKGLTIPKEDAERIGLYSNDHVSHYPACPSIYAIIEFNQNQVIPADKFTHLQQYADQYNLRILADEDIIGRAFSVETTGDKKILSTEVWVPVSMS